VAGRRTAGGQRAGLSRAVVLDAAVGLADAEGLPKLSMRSLAGRLGVEAMSLYHHVAGKDELLDGMVDAVFAEIHLPRAGADWSEELRRRSVSGREAMLRHQWAIGLMDSRRSPGPQTLRHHDAVLGCLRAAGFSLDMAAHAFAVLDAHLYGFVVQELALPFREGDDLAPLAQDLATNLATDQLPHLAEFMVGHALQPGYSFGDEFGYGLDLILEGLARRQQADSDRP